VLVLFYDFVKFFLCHYTHSPLGVSSS
jgi:hypothetical protein